MPHATDHPLEFVKFRTGFGAAGYGHASFAHDLGAGVTGLDQLVHAGRLAPMPGESEGKFGGGQWVRPQVSRHAGERWDKAKMAAAEAHI